MTQRHHTGADVMQLQAPAGFKVLNYVKQLAALCRGSVSGGLDSMQMQLTELHESISTSITVSIFMKVFTQKVTGCRQHLQLALLLG